MNKLAIAGAATLLTGGLVAGTQISPSEAASARKSAKVKVDDDKFVPRVATVKARGTVTWTWVGDSPHDLRGRGGIKHGVQTSGTFRKRFNKAGTYTYVCTIHPGMKGTVKVVR